MQKKNYLRKTLALVMAFLMTVTMMPVNIFAETFPTKDANGKPVVGTTDWTIDEKKEAEMNYWKLSNRNEVVIVANGESIKTPSVNYIGTYINAEGRTVIRVSYRMFQNLSSGVWSKALFKFDKDLYNLIDFNNTGTGMYKGAIDGGWHDSATYSQVVPFADCGISYSGAVNVKEQSLNNNGNKVGGSSRLEIPIDLVLKDGKSVDDLVGQPHVQMRITNDNYTQVFCVAGTEKSNTQKNLIAPYNSYTFMTYIPSANNNADVGTVSDYNVDKQFYSANSYAKYNEAGGYLDVFHKQSKLASGDKIGGESFAFRQVFNEKFAEVLKPIDKSGTVAEVFPASQQGDKWGTAQSIYITMNDLNTSDNSNLNPGFKGIQVASNFNNGTITNTGKFAGLNTVITTTKPQESFLNSSTTEFNSGLPTITRYYIDRDKMAAKGLTTDDLAAFDFYSTFILDSQKKFIEYTATNNTGADIVLPANSKIGLAYSNGKTSTPNLNLDQYSLTFGEGPYKIEMRSNFKHTGKGLNYEYNLIPGMTIKDGEKITFRTMKYNVNDVPRQVELTLPGKTGEKKIILKPGTNGPEMNTPRRLNYITTYAGGSASQTNLPPDVDEIFTDSTKISGRTRYKLAKMRLYYPDNTDFEFTIDDNPLKDVVVNGQTFKGYTFTTDGKSGIYTKNGIAEATARAFAMPVLKKDMPIDLTNRDELKAAVASDKVTEQVQAKVHFNLNGRTSKIDGNPVIDKVAPLNNEYTHKLVGETDPKSNKTVYKMIKNDKNYHPSGFAKIDKKTSEVLGAENLRVDENIKTVKVTQNLKDAQGKDASVERTVINYLDHDNKPYDIKNADSSVKKDEINRLLMRQFPVNEEVNLPSSKRIVGWTTVKLEDKVEQGKLVTAAEQYYKILESKDASNKANKIVRSIADWGKAETEAYVFDEASPIDKERTVYAVYDGLNIILHSNKTDNPDDDIIVRIPVDKSDLDYTNDVLAKLDATTAATLKEKNTPSNGEIIFKRMPSAPYTSNPSEIAKASPLLKDFAIDGKSFIGWSSVRFKNSEPTPGDTDPRFVAGTTEYNERVGKLINGNIGTEQKPKTIPTRTEGYFSIKKDYQELLLPNTFDFSFTPEDFKNENDEELNTFAEVIESGQDIHLYANYRDFFTVTVDPSYNVVTPAEGTHKHGTYGPMADDSKKQTLRIGLLHRTAVTDYKDPTVHPSANYYPVTSSQISEGNTKILQNWDPTKPTKLTWTVVGYDDLGMRKSYVAVVVPEKPEDKETVYNTFTKDKWKDLGIQTYIRLVEETFIPDPDAPKNIFDVKSSDGWDKYGGQRAKTQTLKLERKVSGATPQEPEKTVTDTFTSATARQAVTVKRTVGQVDLKETVGYNIKMANVLETLPTPEFEAISDKDNSVKLKWGNAEKEAGIEEITFSIGSDPKVTLKRGGTSDTFKTDDNQYTATVIDGNLVINTGVLTGKGGEIAKAKYHKMAGVEEVDSEEGTMLISTTKESEPVKDMNQNQKGKKDSEGKELPVKNSEGNPIINFQVPTKVKDQVGEGTKYIAQKWNPETQKWEEVSVTTIDEDANGKEKQIVLDKNKVNHDDIIRIVAKEKDPNGKYTDIEKEPSKNDGTAKLEDGYAKPAESTKVKVSWMEEDPQHQGEYIKVEEDFNPDHIKDGSNPERQKAYKALEDKQYVKLDLKAPTADLKATDSKYRRFIDIIGEINEMPYNQKVTIMIGATENSDENDPANIKEEFDTPEEAIKFLDSLLRKEQMPKIWVIAEDKFGNESQSEVKYEKNPIMTVEVFQAYRNRKYVKVRTERANSTVTIKVMRGQDIYATGTVSGVGPDNFVNLEFKLVNGGTPYRLKTGDILSVEAKCTEGKITYTSNPLFIDIK